MVSGQCPQTLTEDSQDSNSSGGNCVCPDPSHGVVSASIGIRCQARTSQGQPEETWRLSKLCRHGAGVGINLSCPHLDFPIP